MCVMIHSYAIILIYLFYFIYLLLFSIISLACIIYSDPRTHCLVFRIVLRLAKVKLV